MEHNVDARTGVWGIITIIIVTAARPAAFGVSFAFNQPSHRRCRVVCWRSVLCARVCVCVCECVCLSSLSLSVNSPVVNHRRCDMADSRRLDGIPPAHRCNVFGAWWRIGCDAALKGWGQMAKRNAGRFSVCVCVLFGGHICTSGVCGAQLLYRLES